MVGHVGGGAQTFVSSVGGGGGNRGVDLGLGWARGPPPPPNGRKSIALYSARLWAWYCFFSCVLGKVYFFHGKVGGKDKVELHLHRVLVIANASLMDMERKRKSK